MLCLHLKKEKLIKNFAFLGVILIAFVSFKCTKEEAKPEPVIVSTDFYNRMLFIDQQNYQIKTSESATFKKLSTNPNFTISESGLIKQTTINVVHEIEATWTVDGTKTKFFVMAASGTADKNHYLRGWKYIKKLYETDTTRAIVIRL